MAVTGFVGWLGTLPTFFGIFEESDHFGQHNWVSLIFSPQDASGGDLYATRRVLGGQSQAYARKSEILGLKSDIAPKIIFPGFLGKNILQKKVLAHLFICDFGTLFFTFSGIPLILAP